MNPQNLFAEIKGRAAEIFSAEGLLALLEEERPLRVKFGADPSRPDLHLGHTVPLRLLRRLQQAGHEIIFVIGDFTAMIGDPTGKSKTRTSLSFAETHRNGETYFNQVAKLLDPAKTRVVYNSDWLQPLGLKDLLTLTQQYTLARLLERDDFSNRFAAKQPIGVHELLYPLLQGYDSVALRADIEIGGTDQTFNLLVGRELQRAYGQPPQQVITLPLLPGLDGREKMSKSLHNSIGISEPAPILYEKCMRVPDHLLAQYFLLTTDFAKEEYLPLLQNDIRQAHRLFAREIVRCYHGESAVDTAQAQYSRVAGGGVPEKMEVLEVPSGTLLPALIVQAGFAPTLTQARRLLEGGGITLNGKAVTDCKAAIGEEGVLCRGKTRFVRVVPKQ